MSIHPAPAAHAAVSGLPQAATAPEGAASPRPAVFDVQRVRRDFPALRQEVHGHPLVYLDNSATAQKPQAVLDALGRFYERDNANVHRGVHQLSERATRDYEEARAKVRRFLNAAETREVIFLRGATEAINLVAASYGRKNLGAGDEIIVSTMEHHSNIVPWQMLCEQTGAVLRVVPISDDGEFLSDEYEKLLNARTKLVSVVHLSNSLGTVNPAKRIVAAAHARGVPVLLDGAQSVAHLPVDVQELDCDFFVFSGHKLYGPTGIGVLYGKAALLEAMPPWQGGGDMIHSVSFEKTTYNVLPYKFEAGTPHIAGAIGLGAAIDYFESVGPEGAFAHEDALLRHATGRLRELHGVRIIGNARHKSAAISFVVEGPPLSALDVAAKLNLEGIAVRSGHHCCQPVMDRFGIPGTARASFAIYNTIEEVDRFADALRDVVTGASAKVRYSTDAPVAFPKAAADSPEAAADELADVLEFLDDWPQRYQYILELGEELPPLPDEYRTEANRVHGCQSTVYLTARKLPGSADGVEFLADSDANLVRGLIGLLERLFSGQRAAAILAFDVEGFFRRVGLDQHLTLGRRNGLAAMVQRVRKFAAGVAEGGRK